MISIKNKIFTKEDILKIGKIIKGVHDDCINESIRERREKFPDSDPAEIEQRYYGRFKVELERADGTTDTDDSIDLLISNESILDSKKVSSIRIQFSSRSESKSIVARITEGDGNYSTVSISGDDLTWFNTVVTNITEALEDVRPQNNFIYKHKNIFSIIFSLMLTAISSISLLMIFDILGMDFKESSKNDTFIILGVLMAVASSTIWQLIVEKIMGPLWKSIEFDFGPDHLKVNKKRTMYNYAIVAFIFPVLLFVLSKL